MAHKLDENMHRVIPLAVVLSLTACGPIKSQFDRDLDRCKNEATAYIDKTIEEISGGDMSFRSGVTMGDMPTCYVLMKDETLAREEKLKIIRFVQEEMPQLMQERLDKFQKR